MVCHDDRPDAKISVQHRPIPRAEDMFPETRVNVAYCNDRQACTNVARQTGPFPAPYLVLQADDQLAVTMAAVAERAWANRERRLPDVAVGILTWLRDEDATIATLLASYDEPAQTIFDACRALIAMGLVRVVVDRCEPGRRLHSDPHRGCVLR